MRSALRVVAKLADAHEGEPEISEALQQTEQFRLVSNPAHQHRVPAVARQRHALKQRAELVAEFTFGFEAIRSRTHRNTLAHLRAGVADGRRDHLGEMTFPTDPLSRVVSNGIGAAVGSPT
jgi:hypothetical protein